MTIQKYYWVSKDASYDVKIVILRHNKQEVKHLNPYFSHLRGK